MIRPFVILALPRSRTAWLAQFLSYSGWSCGHDEVRHLRSMEDVTSWFAMPCTGTVETAGAAWWRFLKDRDVRVATVRRPVAECADSLMRLGLGFDRDKLVAVLTRADHKLDQVEARLPGVLRVTFGELRTEEGCARLFEHCLPYQHDHGWWETMAALNVQCNMPALMRYMAAHQSQLAKLTATAKQQAIAAMRYGSGEIDGMTIQQEPLDKWRADGVRLFKEHCVQVGEAPESYLGKDWALMGELDRLGALQITTARSNGRLFAYLMAVIAPSLESPDILSATNTFFYASSDVPGLGLKLQRASIDALKARGVTEVLMRAGTRGSGPRMGTLYRRLGAQFVGTDFLLKLKDAA